LKAGEREPEPVDPTSDVIELTAAEAAEDGVPDDERGGDTRQLFSSVRLLTRHTARASAR